EERPRVGGVRAPGQPAAQRSQALRGARPVRRGGADRHQQGPEPQVLPARPRHVRTAHRARLAFRPDRRRPRSCKAIAPRRRRSGIDSIMRSPRTSRAAHAATATVDPMTPVLRLLALPALAGLLVLGACAGSGSDAGGDDADTAASASSAPTDDADADTGADEDFAAPTGPDHDKQAALDLEGRSFTATEVTGHDLVPGSAVTAHFGEGMVSLDAGCNSLGGIFVFDGKTLTVPQLR